MVIDRGHILCHISKLAAGDTEDICTASMDNMNFLTKYSASKKI